MEVEVTFSVSGYVVQRVKLAEGVTADQLQAALDSGEAWTTMERGGNVEVVGSGVVLGRVESVNNECEYTDFSVESHDVSGV